MLLVISTQHSSILCLKKEKWVIHSNQTNKCPVTVQDVEVAQKVWLNNIASPKIKTTRSNPNVVARDQLKIPVGLIKFHNEVFLTCNFFCEQDPILPGVESENILHRSQSPSKLYSTRNIQSFQGGIPVLTTSWIPHHQSACRSQVRDFEEPDRVPNRGSTSKSGCSK